MRRKCKWCEKVKTVTFHTLSGEFFCSQDCVRKAFHLRFLADIVCPCGTPIRMNGIVQRRYTDSDLLYCCEKCALEYLGIIQDAKEAT